MHAPESLKSRLLRYAVNITPVFRATGAWITHISSDVRLVKLKLPLTLKTKNPMGTMCGGNMYSAVHGIYAVMLARQLGGEYVCVDRFSTIKFLRPGKGAWFTQFELTQAEVDEVKSLVEQGGKAERQYRVELKDHAGATCCEIACAVHVRKKRAG